MNQALEIKEPFHLAILDMHMPHMDGMQLARKIYADPNLARTRMMMLTSSYSCSSQLDRQNIGILRCVSKPVRQQELFEIINDVIKQDRGSPMINEVSLKQDFQLIKGLQGRVLLAEDNLVNQDVARAMLAKLGLEVEIAHNGKEALELVSKHDYDVILMDCQMPVMDGLEATSLIRKQLKNGVKLPIIAVTANASEEDRSQCLGAGMNDFLSKPYSLNQLRQILLSWLPKEKINTTDTESKIPDTSTSNSPVLNPIQLDQIRSLDTSGKNQLIHRILQAFLETTESYIQQIEQTLIHENAESLRQAAHALKSSSANIGAESLAKICKELEVYGKTGELSRAKLLKESLKQHYQQVISEIKIMLTQS
jgi:CheY-like chemotaxis protein/HPt (histidine-containing phosphotransfer) domain-containing protein